MMRLGDGLELRPATEAHRGYVLSTWIRDAGAWRRGRGWPRYPADSATRQLAEALYGLVWVAIKPEDPGIVHAWVCGSPGLLFYVYVPHDMAGHGLAARMIHAVTEPPGRAQDPHE